MMTERWYQTPCGTPKGGTLQLAHSWATGLVLYAAEELRAFGHVALDGETGAAVALEAVEIEKTADGAWSLRNPWGADLDLVVVVRRAGHGARGLLRETLRVPAEGTAQMCWNPAPWAARPAVYNPNPTKRLEYRMT
jgi:hypothetical protein